MRLARSERTILSLLVEKSPRYGLELVAASSGRLTRGGIYVTLGRMEEKGLVASTPSEGGRRLYEPTSLGHRALLAARVFAGEIMLDGAKP